ncbi:VWA domain-containing protein [Methanohalophilus sp.]|uniref:vWA domain-containing protein n=1 Tax=Methanohalophilus sp. TaxID=1966352 RepID=UPI002627611A|nr:VWA domain-containing protein [Methanohalophilus sp.]MDK2891798.1 hypothetical protein [Methanohalophilus sp.]
MFSFENPLLLLLIIPVIIGAIYFLIKGGSRSLIISRMIVLSLLVVALAGPYTFISEVTQEENPQLVIISDNTDSMQLFEKGVGDEIYESLSAKTPTTFVEIDGDKTPLGDAIMQYSMGDRQIVLVTDGNNNYGADLEEAFEVAKETDTTVYAVVPDLMYNDLSVQIEGEKVALQDNGYNFKIIVKQASDDFVKCDLKVYVDGVESTTMFNDIALHRTRENIIVPKEGELPIFDEVGEHIIEVEIIPESRDYDPINNKFIKSIYVIPKPKVQYITEEQYQSGLLDILNEFYKLSVSSDFNNLDDKKAVVLDNIHINSLSEEDINKLDEYVLNGGGLVVVGGDRSYDRGEYLNSSLEMLLPVISEPTETTGGEVIVFLLDTSGSASGGDYEIGEVIPNPSHPQNPETSAETINIRTLDLVVTSTLSFIGWQELWDAKAGFISFSKDAKTEFPMTRLNTETNRNDIKKQLLNLTSGAGTNLHVGIEAAGEMLEKEAGKKTIIILSDGKIEESYTQSINVAKQLKQSQNIDFVFIQVTNPVGINYARNFIEEVEGTDKLEYNYILAPNGIGNINEINNPFEPEKTEDLQNETSEEGQYKLIELNPTHFISRDSNTTSNITGYNDVTAKPGADRIIITNTGKPVITAWRYGLGRVVAITTDNGRDYGWSREMYANDSRLISASLNWAIADPQIKEGQVVEADDTWYGIPAEVTVTMYDTDTVPKLVYEGSELELSLVGRNKYKATINPSKIGIHHVSGYPIAVNYGIEYRDVGINEELLSLIDKSDGKVYSKNEAKALLLSDARENSYKPRLVQVSQKMYYILAALLLFLLEVCLSRGREIIEANKKEKASEK